MCDAVRAYELDFSFSYSARKNKNRTAIYILYNLPAVAGRQTA